MQYTPSPATAPLAGIKAKRLGREFAAAIGLTLFAASGLVGADAWPARMAQTAFGFVASAQAQSAQRIVAVGGVVTEVLYALGLQERIVGVDTTSQWPPEALKEKKSVGYVRALSAEGVLSLKPTLVIAVEGAGPPDALALVREAGLPMAAVPEALTPEAVVSKIEIIGKAAGAAEPAKQLAAGVKARFEELDKLRAGLPKPRRVLFVLSLQNGRTMVGGRNSTADAIIALAGGVNAAEAVEGYKPMTDEAIITAAPDYVLMMRHSAAPNATPEELFAMPAFSQTPAAKAKSLIRMDGLYLLGFGPRTPNAARDLMAALYPEARIAQLPAAQ
ncbi:heme/hemin ABC transporter substrate-binding protein [Bosea sp. (in: a-proteobacteria)]|uniref:heme/hemin ABC transporter substrate-binding protein n=1 Tax=Bosea sp. (in: a-proteobacteria) TaxID=1871050 RepID=UPI002FCA5A0A